MKIKFTSDYSLFLKKMLELHNMVIIVGSVFREDNKFYLQDFLDEFLDKDLEAHKSVSFAITGRFAR